MTGITSHGALPAELGRARRGRANGPRAIPAGGGILLGMLIGLLLWLPIILATVALVRAL